jgi:hypothetical protein
MMIRRVAIALGAAALLGSALAPAAAQQATVQIVARGLDNPRGLDVGPRGGVYVAEAGRAGPKCRNPQECFGFTGGITKITATGTKKVGKGLLSLGGKDGSFTVGSNDVAVRRGGGLATIVSSVGPKPRRIGGRVARQSGNLLNVRGKKKRLIAQIDVFEFKNNPDGTLVDSNPYSVDITKGRKVVVDAGGNSLLAVRKNGTKRLIAVFPQRTFDGRQIDSVPTSVAVGPDGNYYVGELGGDGTPEGKARVWRVTPQGDTSIFRRGFDTIVGIDFGPDGDLYVVELFRDGFAQLETGDLTGSLIKVAPNGNRNELVEGRLNAPGGVAVDADGNAYVSTNSVFPGRGRVLKITEN